MKFNSCFFILILRNKSNKAAEEGNFALPNISAKITIFYCLIPNILEYIYIYEFNSTMAPNDLQSISGIYAFRADDKVRNILIAVSNVILGLVVFNCLKKQKCLKRDHINVTA